MHNFQVTGAQWVTLQAALSAAWSAAHRGDVYADADKSQQFAADVSALVKALTAQQPAASTTQSDSAS